MRDERGLSTLELALVLPILLTLLFGIVEFSRALSLKFQLTNAARDAARFVALNEDTEGSLDGLVDDLVNETLGLVDADVTITEDCSEGENAEVIVSQDFQPLPPMNSVLEPFTEDDGTILINAVGVMPCGG